MLKLGYFYSRVNTLSSVLLKNNGCSNIDIVHVRNMTSKQFRVKKAKPPPFPYEKKKYNLVRSLFDKTFKRFDENTKLIVIEGPIAAGKNKLAKIIADEFEMKYVPDVTLDDYYINPYGYDMRNLDYKLPLKTQSFDEKKFCLDPFHINVCRFQVMKYMLRFSSYWDSLNHILNTGTTNILVFTTKN